MPIANIVLSARLNTNVDLRKFSLLAPFNSIKYRQFDIGHVVIRFTGPKATVLLYRNGKVVCNGVREVQQAELALARITHALQEMGYDKARISNMRIVNVVASSQLGSEVDLNRLSSCRAGSIFEKEIFPGANFRLNNGVTVVAFENGKFFVTGAKSVAAAEASVLTAERILRQYSTGR